MSEAIATGQVAVGIDAGGSATRARAVAAGRVVFEGHGGPGNPLAATADVLTASYRAALAGCPEPARIAACVSGAGGTPQREQISGLLADLFPAAAICVVPDYAGAWLAAPEGTDAVVIAGTGSAVCSLAPDGGHDVSGGRGWILGDRGSAARLGQAVLEWFCDDSESDPAIAGLVGDCLGLTDWRQIVRALAASANPAALLARAAPALTGAAASGSDWAAATLSAEMGALGATTAGHIERHLRPGAEVRIALAGGVWTSPAARTAFLAALTGARAASRVILSWPVEPLNGAVGLASTMARPNNPEANLIGD
ncbi:MAG: BadF/BadG/BcrA/BcrD ATPase family protein [Streptosporangiaceae bacterium]